MAAAVEIVGVHVPVAVDAAGDAYLENPAPLVTVTPWATYSEHMPVPAETLTIAAHGTEYTIHRRVFLNVREHWRIQTLYELANTREPCEPVVLYDNSGTNSLAIKRTEDALHISIDSPSLDYIQIPYTCALACEHIERWISAVLMDYVPDLVDGMATLVNVWSPTPVIHWSEALRARMQVLHGGFLDEVRTTGVITGSDRFAPALECAIRELGVHACFDDATDVTFIRLPYRALPFITYKMRRVDNKYVERIYVDTIALRKTLPLRIPTTHSVADSAHMCTSYYVDVEHMLFTETLYN